MDHGVQRCVAPFVVGATILAPSAAAQVNLPPGFEVVEFAVSDKITYWPKINNCGEIVFVKDRFENSRVYLYDNGQLTRLTDYNNGLGTYGPDINGSGTIVWSQSPRGRAEDGQIVVFQGGRRQVLGPGLNPRINNLGHVAWERFLRFTCHSEYAIYLYDGNSIRTILDDGFNNTSCAINDSDWVVWTHDNVCQQPWIGDVWLARDDQLEVIPSPVPQNTNPCVNNWSQIVWGGWSTVRIWENETTRDLIEAAYVPYLNNHGEVAYLRWDEGLQKSQTWVCLTVNATPGHYRLVAENSEHILGDINDWGEVTWRWLRDPPQGDYYGGIRYLRRVRTGDARFDGEIDLVDHRALTDCLSGPGRVDRLCDCRFLDLDYDGDVDLADYARFQNAFGRE